MEENNAVLQSEEITLDPPKDGALFRNIGLVTVIFAIFYTVCTFENPSGIVYILLAEAMGDYAIFVVHKEAALEKRTAYIYKAAMLLAGCGLFIMANDGLIVALRILMYLLTVLYLINSFCRDVKWTARKYFEAGVSTVFAPWSKLACPFRDAMDGRKRTEKTDKYKYIAGGLLLALPVMVIVIILLSSADAVFDNMMGKVSSEMFASMDIFKYILIIAAAFFYCYGCVTFLKHYAPEVTNEDKRKGEPIMATTVVSVLTLIYLLFSFIQIIYLFIGHMTLPEGFTYAQYARTGFFQLLFVCLLNEIIVLVCLRYVRPDRVLNIVLSVMTGCTYIMLSSSFLRMIMYVEAYGLTVLRLQVLFAIAVLALIMAGTLINIFRESFNLLNYMFVVVTTVFLLFVYVKPDYLIAKCNISLAARADSEYELDVNYLLSLSKDAAPAIYEYGIKEYTGMEDTLENTDISNYFLEIKENANCNKIRGFNLSAMKAEKYADMYLKK